jgi:hypothetical protein
LQPTTTLQQQLEVRNIEFEDETEEGLEKQVNIQFCKELKQELKLQGFEVRDARCADLSKKRYDVFMFFFCIRLVQVISASD